MPCNDIHTANSFDECEILKLNSNTETKDAGRLMTVL
jgi:hypothetical protein